ncbi:MAG: transcriptional accessory protein [Peptococcaceae bacterium]|nr:transcriptional accessory protein [Peptococcaceae bacterium]
MDFTKILSQELSWSYSGTAQAIKLLEEGNTIPFIARYRKEATGEMDEATLRKLAERLEYLKNLTKRKEEILRLIEELGKLTPELTAEINEASTLQQLEDLYRPYRPKRRTRASIAKEQGLEPLAQVIADQSLEGGDLLEIARTYLNPEAGIDSPEAALAGARDIVAEQVADDPLLRELARKVYWAKGELVTKGESAEPTPYEMYYAYREPVRSIPPHRVLAINRGEKEDVLKVRIEVPEEEIINLLYHKLVTNPGSLGAAAMGEAVEDGCKRLLFPSLEREIRNELTAKGEEQAIKVFSHNLRNLLLQPPLRNQVVLGIDPGFRTGCKLAVVEETGKLLEVGVIYPHPPQNKKQEAKELLQSLVKKWHVHVIAIGNGTASRETEAVVAEFIRENDLPVKYTIVSEAGASVYSASPLAAKEFPELDLSYRSGISIARRLQDPLAELVKIDPKSVGVGQYQHDVNAKDLNQALAGVVESCVNTVGVELNTASISLLQYVAGLSASVAKAIVARREKEGKFRLREELLKVPRLGPQTFQQCAGFIRIAQGDNPLENTPVHPESYELACLLLAEIGFALNDLRTKGERIRAALENVDPQAIARKLGAGVPTVRDIIEALKRPGRDPREDLPPVLLRQDVLTLDDLQEGMVLQGTVRNVVDFGAFVDIGVKQDGLVHLSQMSDKYIRHPMEVVAVGDIVKVAVLSVDKIRGRISLTMRGID